MPQEPIEDDPLTPEAPAPQPRTRNPDGTFAPTPAEPPPDIHPSWLYSVASDLGITKEECDELSPGALGNAIRRARRAEQGASRQASRDDVRMSARGNSWTEPHNPAPEPPAPVEDPFDLTGIEDQLDPKFRRYLKALKERADKVDALEQQLAGFGQREQQRELTSNAQVLDAAFEALGDEYKDVFGDGDAAELGPEHAAEMKRRVHVVQDALGNTPAQSLTRRQLHKKIKEAAEMLFPKQAGGRTPAAGGRAEPPDPYAAAQQQAPRPARRQAPSAPPAPRASNRAVPTEQEWDDATLAQPTQRRGGSEPNGRAKAIRSVQEIMRQGGDGATDAEIDEGLMD
jgi:hypothetical protein